MQEIAQLREYLKLAKNPEDLAAVQQILAQLGKPAVGDSAPQPKQESGSSSAAVAAHENRNAEKTGAGEAFREGVAAPEKLTRSARIEEGLSSSMARAGWLTPSYRSTTTSFKSNNPAPDFLP